MPSKIKIFVLMMLFIFPFKSFAGNYQTGLRIDRLFHDKTGVYFGFTTTPTDCAGHWFLTQAFLPIDHFAYEGLLSILLTAKTTEKKIDIWYKDRGDCTSSSSELLEITGIGISAAMYQ